MTSAGDLTSRAAQLRAAFDRAFAAPRVESSERREDLLCLRIAGDPYALRVQEMGGIVAHPVIVPVPAAAPSLLGIAGIRGDIVPVFGLPSLLGYGGQVDSPRWVALAGVGAPIALGFPELEAYVRVSTKALHASDDARETRRCVSLIAALDGGARPVISIPLVIESIRNRSGQRRPEKEQ